ncbi:MAG TPA: biotin carboxylase N-terminal domain-containing protein [Candidatus Acidoferrum sp.]|nr:biotin carboxylase N-terminal domain-containing protein [Candidatus Acidoferrum sp.]
MKFRRILIANRGEIAVRVIRTCEHLGIETVLAASEADLDSVAARCADRVICIGPASPAQSYLNIEAVASAAVTSRADALHPGYGFLSENSRLAAACDGAGIVFIGPTEGQLNAVGDKLNARNHATQAGLTPVPGGEVRTPAEARQLAESIGWPVLLKAVSGGGGRGMKRVNSARELESMMSIASAEAQAAFADSRLYLERYIEHGRHIEVQILGDGENTIHLGTRDCSIQRRHQKILEEAPAPNLSDGIRDALHRSGVAFANHLRYRGLGTVEFLLDCDSNLIYFLEMNARIQVEHPVTEETCGLDLVEEQIAVAEGQKLRWKQSDITFQGHAIECRINAEDWRSDFRPCPGVVSRAVFPVGQGIRVDTHAQSGANVPPQYDSLVAKLIVQGANRTEAISKMGAALSNLQIHGIETNVGLQELIVNQKDFIYGAVTTSFLHELLANRTIEAA